MYNRKYSVFSIHIQCDNIHWYIFLANHILVYITLYNGGLPTGANLAKTQL